MAYLSHGFLGFDLHFLGCLGATSLPTSSFFGRKLDGLLSIGLLDFQRHIHLPMCFWNILLRDILPHRSNEMIKPFLGALSHPLICS